MVGSDRILLLVIHHDLAARVLPSSCVMSGLRAWRGVCDAMQRVSIQRVSIQELQPRQFRVQAVLRE